MRKYTIIVDVVADSQEEAFSFVELAVEQKLEDGHFVNRGISHEDGSVNVRTPDGVKSVVF
jgi:hypothetical protein